MHIHISVITAIDVFLMWLIVKTVWEWVAQKLADYPLGQAMAYIVD